MSAIVAMSPSSVPAVTLTRVSTGLSGTRNAADEPTLLPSAESPSGNGLNEAMGILYEMLSSRRQLDVHLGEARVSMDHDLREKAMADRLAAFKEQKANEANSGSGFFSSIGHFFEDTAKDAVQGRFDLVISDTAKDAEAAWNSPAFWRDLEQGAMVVAKAAVAVGSVAVTIATAGAAAPLLVATAIALSAGGLVISKTGCLDGALGNGASQWVALAMQVGGAAVNVGGGLAATGACGGSQAVALIGTTATVSGGGLEVVAGAAQVRNGSFAADSERAATDETRAAQRASRLDRLIQSLIESIQQGDESQQRAQGSLASAISTNAQTAVTATDFTVKG